MKSGTSNGMQTESTAPSASENPDAGGKRDQANRDFQRDALRRLVELSSASSKAESTIEQEHDQAVADALASRQADERAIAEHHQSEEARLRRTYDQHAAHTASRQQADRKALKKSDETQHRRLDHERDSVARHVKKEYDQLAWLAESVHDVTLSQIDKESKLADQELAANLQAVEEMETRAAELLALYGQKPPVDTAERQPPARGKDASAAYVLHRDSAAMLLAKLGSLPVPQLMVGARPYIAGLVICVLAAGITQLLRGTDQLQLRPMALAFVVAGVAWTLIAIGLRMLANTQIRSTWLPLARAMQSARQTAKATREHSTTVLMDRRAAAEEQYKKELKDAKAKFQPLLDQAGHTRETGLRQLAQDTAKQTALLDAARDKANHDAQAKLDQGLESLAAQHERQLRDFGDKHAEMDAQIEARHAAARTALQDHWQSELADIQAPMQPAAGENQQALMRWDETAWRNWTPPTSFPATVRFGEFHVDLKQITDEVPKTLTLPPRFSVPATLAFPRRASLLFHTDHAGRAQAISTLRMVMARLLTQVPPGRVQFTIIDPVGLGENFAGFMHLADQDEALVGSRIWTESDHIDQRLANLTEHMETVIQKYLRNEFATIDDYNAQAGELAEPYRYLVISDFPVAFQGDAFRRLASIASSGARCGVYTLIARDTRVTLPADAHLEELEAHSINLVRQGDAVIWKDEVFKQFPLTLDPPPQERALTEILTKVGQGAREAKRVEVAFASVAPPPGKFWSGDSKSELSVPIGRLGATRLQMLRLGRGVAQHVLIAGKTGSGKSTLLHALITNLAMWYSPDEVEFYLVDFKKGVEFKTYATHDLPHARAVAVESDREFGLSVLQRLDAELARRGELFRAIGAQDLAGYRQATGKKMPRTLLIIDEFQEFFSEDDKLAQDATVLLDRLVRQGRAFGIHVLLGSQTIGGSSGLARSTIGQMAIRIALQTSEADSQLILGDANSAARLLTRPGEAIYNDAGGLVEGNSPFQIAWLPDDEREGYLTNIHERAMKRGDAHAPPIVFEGNQPADITKNHPLMDLLKPGTPGEATSGPPTAWLGEPVAIKSPTAITFRRQSGANALLVGQQEESATAIFASMMISLAARREASPSLFYLMDGTPTDSPLAGTLEGVVAALPQDTRVIDYRAVPEAINELALELGRRQADENATHPSLYVFMFGLQRYRALRKQEESFSFSSSDEEKPPAPDKQFADLLREGPSLGIHVITWADTVASVERTLDRASMREFDNRILFQMSANDSSNLIDSPAANKLGMHRALAFSEERGVIEKFRPYAPPTPQWLQRVHAALSPRKGN